MQARQALWLILSTSLRPCRSFARPPQPLSSQHQQQHQPKHQRQSTHTARASSSSASSLPRDWVEDESQTRIFMPSREVGYRTVPLSWDELVHIIEVQNDLKRLSRSVEQEKVYQIYRRDLQQAWVSVPDHILHSKFGLERRTDDATGKYYAYPPLSELASLQRKSSSEPLSRVTVVRNDFPYYLEDGIWHYLLWKLGDGGSSSSRDDDDDDVCVVTDADMDRAREQITRETGANEFLHWISPPHLKSIPEIDHVHFICRKKPPPR